MITPEMIQRINALSRKKKEMGLTAEEKTEQSELRRVYLQNIKNQLKDCLDNIEFIDEPQVKH